jgi:branched-chain amino acid transport system substrate-binding protein
MITYDTKADVNEAINGFTRAVTLDKVSVIIGPPVANIALAIAPISEQYDVPVLAFVLDSRAQVKEDGVPYKNMFGFQPNAVQQGSIMASYAMKNGFKTFGAIYNQGNAYSVSLMPPFVDTVKAGGGQVLQQVQYNPADRDFKTLLSGIIAAKVDAIYVPNYTQELILITQQARALGYEGALICGLDACPPFNTLLGEDPVNTYFINNVDDTEPDLQAMIKDVKAKTGVDATNKFFLGYDVANVLAQIFKTTTVPAEVCAQVANLKNYKGLTGNITIDPKTHTPTGLEMWMFKYEGMTPVMLERYSVK